MAPVIRTDTSPEAMRQAIGDNYIAYWRMLAESGLIYVKETDELITYGPTKEPSAFKHGVLLARFGEEGERRTDETLAALGFPRQMLFWWELPGTSPPNIGELLERKGFALRDNFPGMAVEIESVRWKEPPSWIEIERVRDPERFHLVNQTAAVGLGQQPDVAEFLYGAYCAAGFQHERWVPYLATIDGTPVGTTIVAFGGGVAGIYAVAVLKGARRRGVGSALTLTALRDARERGYRIATLRASRMGYPMYRRLGFEQHCTIGSWVSEPQQRP